MPKVSCRRCNKMEWSTVSKAADRSRRTKAATSPRSTACRISDSTRRTAVSVEWPCRNPDCKGGRRSADDRYSISWRTTRRSRSFDSTDKFDIGRYELGFIHVYGALLYLINSYSCEIEGKFKLYTAIVLSHKSQMQNDIRYEYNTRVYDTSQLDITT